MSLYNSIPLKELILRPLRILSNVYYSFISGPKTGKPFKIKFEGSTICNLKCVMCPLTKGIDREKGVLKFENFKKVFDEIMVPYLNLTGLGEPLMNPDIFRIIRYARSKGALVKLDTNATLLNKQNIMKLIAADPTFISVSIDGATKKSYESIRVGAKFEKVIANLKNLITFRNLSKSKTKIHLFFVLQKNNVGDLIEFIKFGDSIGVDSINGNIAISFGRAENKEKVSMDLEKIGKLREELIKIKKKIKVHLNIENIEDYLNSPKDQIERMTKKPCYYPWYNPCVTWDGYVVPCDIHCNNEVVFGNAFKEGFMNVWNNKRAQEFRKNLLNKREGICAKCCIDESFIDDKLKLFYKMPLLGWLSNRK